MPCSPNGRSHLQTPSQVCYLISTTIAHINVIVELIKRLRALTLRLLPLEVDVKTISDPTSRIITPLVMLSYMEAAGDFGDAVSPLQLRDS